MVGITNPKVTILFMVLDENTIGREGTKVANSAGLKIQFRRDSWVRLPSLAFPPQGQISSSIENSLRSFKTPSPTESNVFSGTGSGAPTLEPVQFHHIKPDTAARSSRKQSRMVRLPKTTALLSRIMLHGSRRPAISVQAGSTGSTFHLVKMRRFLGPYRTNTIDDIYVGISRLKNARTKGHPYTARTVRDDITTLKKFYLWLIKKGISHIPKDEIREIKAPSGNTMTKTAAQMLTEEEIHQMIKACNRSIDRCYIAVLYEAALRIKELGTLTWDQVSFGKNTVIINTDGKTGKPRHIPLIMAKPYLAAWRADYPLVAEGSAYVFISEQEKKPLRYKALEKRLRVIAQRAGITKKISPHVIRHTRISHLVKQGVREYSIREIGWGNQIRKCFRRIVICSMWRSTRS